METETDMKNKMKDTNDLEERNTIKNENKTITKDIETSAI